MTLGDIIKAYRNAHDYSMGDFAKLSGLSKPYISMLERDINSSTGKPIIPSVPTLQAVAKVMGISLDVLMKQIDDEQLISVSEDETPYYLNPETAKLAQELYDNPDCRVLLDATRDLRPEDVKALTLIIKQMKKKDGSN